MISLLARQFRARPWPTLLLALTVALLSFVAALIPRMAAELDDRQLERSLATVSAVQGDVSALWTTYRIAAPGAADLWGGPREATELIRAAQPEPLRSLLQPAQFVGKQPVSAAWRAPEGSPYFGVKADILLDPDLPDHAVLIDGAWPEIDDDDSPFQIAIVDKFAERAQLEAGDEVAPGLVVTAVFRPLDGDDTRWEHIPYGRGYAEASDADRGLQLLGGVFVAPGLAAGDPSARLQSPFSYDVFFGLDSGAVASRRIDVSTLGAQLTGLLAKRHSPVVPGDGGANDPATFEGNQPISFHSDLNVLLTRLDAQQRTTHTLVGVSAVGPIGVGVALVALGAQLVVHRRRSATALLSARGTSPRQLRGLLAAEGIVFGLPAALVGLLLAGVVVPGPTAWWGWLACLAIGVLPAAALSWSAGSGQRGRREIASGKGRWRLVTEVLIGIAAAGATWRLLSTRGAQGSGVDLLGAAAPVLLALLACLIVLRLYPAPLRLLLGFFARGRGFTGFMGAARALREPAGGVVPVVTIVLGTTLSVTAAALLGTIAVGTERAVWADNGSTVHISGPRFSDETAQQLRGVDGVEAVALVRLASDNSALKIGADEARVRVWLADAELVDAYAAARDGSPLPAGLFDQASPVPVVLGGSGTRTSGAGTLADVGDVTVAGHLGVLPGVTDETAWALVATENWPGDSLPPAKTALIAAAPGTDLAALTAELSDIVPQARITTVEAELRELRESPTVAGLSAIFITLTIVTAVLMMLAIFTAQVMTADDRRAAAAVLRTLGLRPRQLRTLTAWELGPVVVVALLLGAAVGIGIAALMLATVDFRALTGGSLDPALYLDPLWIGGVGVGLLLAAALAVALSSWFAGRTNIAQELRLGEER